MMLYFSSLAVHARVWTGCVHLDRDDGGASHSSIARQHTSNHALVQMLGKAELLSFLIHDVPASLKIIKNIVYMFVVRPQMIIVIYLPLSILLIAIFLC